MRKTFYLYILSNYTNKVLYIGSTSNLVKRIFNHKLGIVSGFTKKYKVYKLVYVEASEDMELIVRRELQLKKWKRAWKNQLITQSNPEWKDLYFQIK